MAFSHKTGSQPSHVNYAINVVLGIFMQLDLSDKTQAGQFGKHTVRDGESGPTAKAAT